MSSFGFGGVIGHVVLEKLPEKISKLCFYLLESLYALYIFVNLGSIGLNRISEIEILLLSMKCKTSGCYLTSFLSQ